MTGSAPLLYALLSESFKVYADIFFIINLSMDSVLLFLVALIIRAKKKPPRILAAAILTAALPIFQMIFPGNAIFSFVISMVCAFTACGIAFEGVGFIRLCISFALFSSLSAVISELLTRLYTYLDEISFLSVETHGSGGIIPLALCLALSFISWLITCAVKRIKKRKKTLESKLTVLSDGRAVEMSAYCDSGNLLREPIGGLPVIITGSEKMKNILPESLHGVFFSSKSSLYDEPSLSDARRVRIIPIMPIGASGARILFGYVPDKILLDGSEVSACIALDTVSSSFGGCEALLPGCLVK